MTREAVLAGFDRFVTDAIEQTAAEFRVSAVIGGGGGTLDKLLQDSDMLHEQIVEPELAEYRQETIDQFEVTLDWVESGEQIDAYSDKILAAGPFSDSIRDDLPADQRRDVEETLIERHRQLGEGVRTLVTSAESEFWAAARTELDQQTAEELVEEHFAFTGPLKQHRDSFAMMTTIDPEEILGGLGSILGGSTFDIEYTDEAMRAMRHAEREVIADAKAEVRERFDG